ncbi:MAG: HAMP domain-containing sensor histidine kinase [bacterium]
MGLGPRRVWALAILAGVLVGASAALEVSKTTRLALVRARTESALVAGAVQRQLDLLLRDHPDASLGDLAHHPNLQLVLGDALVQASSVLYAAVADSSGIVVAHSLPARVGKPVAVVPDLPSTGGTLSAIRALYGMNSRVGMFQNVTRLERDGVEFATIHVVVPVAFLRKTAHEYFGSGALVSAAAILLAIVSAVFLTRFATGRLREIGEGVEALRAGRDWTPRESGADEFGRLAARLTEWGQQYREERRERDRARVLMTLGEMSAGVVHELRAPLQTLTLDLDSLSVVVAGDEEGEARVAEARRKVRRLDRAIRGYLAIARLRPSAMQVHDVRELIRRYAEELEPDVQLGGLDLVTEVPDGPEWIEADEIVLGQAVSNLVRNALHAQPSRDGRIVLRADRAGDKIRIVVTDTGPGLAPEDRERVFELFYTTRADGTGVGLPLVQRTAELHGGQIVFESEPGVGTTVSIQLAALESATTRQPG